MDQQFLERLKSGEKTTCECCGRYAQMYKRKITSTMAKQLLEFVRAGGAKQYIHTAKVVSDRSGAGDFAKLRYWGLIMPLENDNPAKKTSGYWTLTHEGRSFIKGLWAVAEYIFVYDDEVIGRSDKVAFFHDCLKQHFNYGELMEWL